MRILRLSIVAVPLLACGDNQKQASSPDAAATPDAASNVGTAIPLTTPDGSFYTAMVTIGSQMFALDVDTGSTTVGVAGASCSACTGISPLYAPGTSAMD